MDDYSVYDLSNPANFSDLSGDLNIITFAEQFNSEKFSRNPDFVVGCGPYRLKEWTTGQRVVLLKKENWWGEQFVGKETRFDNYPDKIVYEIIVDNTTAVTAMKDESIDVMGGIPSKDYVDLKENEDFKALFNLHEPIAPSYSYIGLNNKSPKLEDKRVRQALSMALDYETINRVINYNLAERTVGPVHPNKTYYNKDIALYPYDLNTSKVLLDESGWLDNDGNGVREKFIDGETIELDIEFLLVAGSESAENIALMLKNNMAKNIWGKKNLVEKILVEENLNQRKYFGQNNFLVKIRCNTKNQLPLYSSLFCNKTGNIILSMCWYSEILPVAFVSLWLTFNEVKP